MFSTSWFSMLAGRHRECRTFLLDVSMLARGISLRKNVHRESSVPVRMALANMQGWLDIYRRYIISLIYIGYITDIFEGKYGIFLIFLIFSIFMEFYFLM